MNPTNPGDIPLRFPMPPQDTPPTRYLCQRCANCCRWPGDVHVDDAEITRLARFLDIGESEFIERHARLNHRRTGLSLTEQDDGSCIFLKQNRCLVQAVKPRQCEGFPNRWRFPGWRRVCEAVPVAAATGKKRSLAPGRECA